MKMPFLINIMHVQLFLNVKLLREKGVGWWGGARRGWRLDCKSMIGNFGHLSGLYGKDI